MASACACMRCVVSGLHYRHDQRCNCGIVYNTLNGKHLSNSSNALVTQMNVNVLNRVNKRGFADMKIKCIRWMCQSKHHLNAATATYVLFSQSVDFVAKRFHFFPSFVLRTSEINSSTFYTFHDGQSDSIAYSGWNIKNNISTERIWLKPTYQTHIKLKLPLFFSRN